LCQQSVSTKTAALVIHEDVFYPFHQIKWFNIKRNTRRREEVEKRWKGLLNRKNRKCSEKVERILNGAKTINEH